MKWSPTLGVGEMVNSKNHFVSYGDEDEESQTSYFRPVQQVTANCSQQQLVGNEQEPDSRNAEETTQRKMSIDRPILLNNKT